MSSEGIDRTVGRYGFVMMRLLFGLFAATQSSDLIGPLVDLFHYASGHSLHHHISVRRSGRYNPHQLRGMSCPLSHVRPYPDRR